VGSCDLIAYYYVRVCLFIPFITQVITDATHESCYCVSYQFTVLGRVEEGGSWCIVLVIRIVICSFVSALFRWPRCFITSSKHFFNWGPHSPFSTSSSPCVRHSLSIIISRESFEDGAAGVGWPSAPAIFLMISYPTSNPTSSCTEKGSGVHSRKM
jgi:hypothetical protein